MSTLTIKNFVNNYEAGLYDTEKSLWDNDCGGWYDWFCRDSSLVGKTKKMYTFLKGIKNPYILDNFRVWFKNNCPLSGSLYDDCRFEPLNGEERDSKYFGIQFGCPWEECKFSVFTARNDYKVEFKFDSMKELRAWLEDWKG